MSDAWNAKGWTAQQTPWYYTDDSLPGSWTLPDDVDLVTVSGKIGDADGGRPKGFVLFEANAPLKHPASGTLIMKPQYYSRVLPTGESFLTLPATDSPALVSTEPPFIYTVSIVFGRRLYKTFTTSLPLATPSVSLLDLLTASGV